MSDLCERIRRWREAAGLNQTELAKAVGVSPSAVCQWESSKYETDPSMENLDRIATACGVSLQIFFGKMPAEEAAAS